MAGASLICVSWKCFGRLLQTIHGALGERFPESSSYEALRSGAAFAVRYARSGMKNTTNYVKRIAVQD